MLIASLTHASFRQRLNGWILPFIETLQQKLKMVSYMIYYSSTLRVSCHQENSNSRIRFGKHSICLFLNEWENVFGMKILNGQGISEMSKSAWEETVVLNKVTRWNWWKEFRKKLREWSGLKKWKCISFMTLLIMNKRKDLLGWIKQIHFSKINTMVY